MEVSTKRRVLESIQARQPALACISKLSHKPPEHVNSSIFETDSWEGNPPISRKHPFNSELKSASLLTHGGTRKTMHIDNKYQ